MASTYVSTTARSQAPAAAPAAAPQPDDNDGLHKALRAERQARQDAEKRLNRIRQEVAAQLQGFSDRLHRLEQLLGRLQQFQTDQAAEVRELREAGALFGRRIP